MFSISYTEGEIASGNLSLAPITFTYTKGEIYSISYKPTDPMIFNAEIGDLSKGWSGPIIKIDLSWQSNRTKKISPVLNQTSFGKGVSFKEVVKHFSQFY